MALNSSLDVTHLPSTQWPRPYCDTAMVPEGRRDGVKQKNLNLIIFFQSRAFLRVDDVASAKVKSIIQAERRLVEIVHLAKATSTENEHGRYSRDEEPARWETAKAPWR